MFDSFGRASISTSHKIRFARDEYSRDTIEHGVNVMQKGQWQLRCTGFSET